MRNLGKRIWTWLRRRFRGRGGQKGDPADTAEWENPYLSQSRSVIEQILSDRGMDYRHFCPIVIDTDCPGRQSGIRDDVDRVLDQLEEGLNFLEICTDRPEYFEERRDRLKREYGLIMRLLPRHGKEQKYGNMVLDFERKGALRIEEFGRDILYLPFQKRRWSLSPQNGREPTPRDGGNPAQEKLDMQVPIGYNMLTVRLDKNFRQDIFSRNP